MNTEDDEELYSNCCGTPAGEYEDIGICPACKEHCDWVSEDTEEDDE
jgi:hypothetical protein